MQLIRIMTLRIQHYLLKKTLWHSFFCSYLPVRDKRKYRIHLGCITVKVRPMSDLSCVHRRSKQYMIKHLTSDKPSFDTIYYFFMHGFPVRFFSSSNQKNWTCTMYCTFPPFQNRCLPVAKDSVFSGTDVRNTTNIFCEVSISRWPSDFFLTVT